MSAPAVTVEAHAADMGGCGHYRMIWPVDALYTAGVDVELILPGDARSNFEVTADFELTIATGVRHNGRLAKVPDADVIVLQRPLTRQLVHVIRELKREGKAVVVEVDDDFQTIDPHNIAWAATNPTLSPERNWHHLRDACQLADMVTVTSPALAARYGKHGRVRVIPNYVPAHYLHTLRPAEHDELRLGWSGSVDTHPRDLQVTRGAVARVLRRHGLKFHLIGSGRVPLRDPAGHTLTDDAGNLVDTTDLRIPLNLGLGPDTMFAHTGGWLHLEQYPRGVAELDVGIVPLAGGMFNEAKSWLKGLEYAALGVPFVATPTGPYRALHNRGIGELADRPRQWERELDRLVVDEDHRLERAGAGRRIANAMTIERNAGQWADAWSAAAELSTTRTRRQEATA